MPIESSVCLPAATRYAVALRAGWLVLLVGLLTTVSRAATLDDSALDRLIEQLYHADASYLRRDAAEKLGAAGDKRAVEPLIGRLKDRGYGVRPAVVEALGKMGDKRAVEPLIACLKDEDSRVRDLAAHALGKLDDKRAVEPFIACLKDEDWDVRRVAAQALGEWGDKRAVEPLIACLKQTARPVQGAAKALGKLGDKRAVEPLVACLKDRDDRVRGEAVEALRKLGYSSSTVNDEIDLLLARGAWDDVLQYGARAVEPLIAYLKDKDDHARAAAADALGKLGDKRAVGPLIACLKDDEDVVVRGEAAEALGNLGDKRAVPHLIAALPDWPLNTELVAALKQLGWKPTSETEGLYCRIGEQNKERLLEDWAQSKRLLLNEARSGDLRRVKNAVYTAIAMGKEEMVSDLAMILDSCGDASIAGVYLNCGNKDLADAARRWAAKRGYQVIRGGGASGPGWGRW